MSPLARDAIDVEALRTDRYLEALLTGLPTSEGRVVASGPGGPAPGSSTVIDVGAAGPQAPEPAVRTAALRLQRDLQRIHPSFRFEERLSQRLAEVAAAMQLPMAAGDERRSAMVLPFPFRPDDDPAALGLDETATTPAVRRPVLIGGAVASAAISIAGAAFVAWRLGRPGDPMSRAVRAAHHLRMVGPGGLD